MRAAVITIVAGRHDHLVRQRIALDGPEHHVVVAMGGGEVEPCRRLVGDTSDVIAVETQPEGLPLARARNAGAEHALDAGGELLVFLDVDCIPGAALLERYKAAAGSAPALLCGPVSYLPPPPPAGYPAAGLHSLATPHPSAASTSACCFPRSRASSIIC
jgi:GT2 family glycosyltransferase